jgi:FdhE protein
MTTNNNQAILARLREVKEKTPELAEVIDLHYDLLTAQLQTEIHPRQSNLSSEGAKVRLKRGFPLLVSHELDIDWKTFFDLCRDICRITSQHRPDLLSQLEGFLATLENDPDAVRTSVKMYLEEGEIESCGNMAIVGKEQAELLSFVYNNALKPFLQAFADALIPLVDLELWQRGWCPLCSGEPDFAFLESQSGARQLVCSRCDTHWVYPRIKCPFCQTSDPARLSFYPNEDRKYRLYVCKDCKRYLKAVDLRKESSELLLPLERILTVALDLAAREKGFQ